jgi:hypothetical protein
MDNYLTNHPDITFFKAAHKQHTPFSVNDKLIYSSNKIQFNDEVTINIPIIDHLLSSIDVMITLSKYYDYVEDIGDAIIKKIEFYIDGKLYSKMNNDVLNIQKQYASNIRRKVDENKYFIQIPLWFQKRGVAIAKLCGKTSTGASLPICALDPNTKLTLKLTFENKNNCIIGTKNINSFINCDVYTKYICLGDTELNKFTNAGHGYLVEMDLYETINFSHPYKNEIIGLNKFGNKVVCADILNVIKSYVIPEKINVQHQLKLGSGIKDIHFAFKYPKNTKYFNYERISEYTKIIIDDEIRFENNSDYYTIISQFEYAENIKNLYAILFALNIFEHQPSGAHNFSGKQVIMDNLINTSEMCKYGLDCELVIMTRQYSIIQIIDKVITNIHNDQPIKIKQII